MESLGNLLNEIGREAEYKVKRELSGPAGALKAFFYNVITPLVLNFETEHEVYHFVFQRGGSVSVQRGLHANPDVKVIGEHAELLYLLQNRDAKRFELAEKSGKIKIVCRTFKGGQTVVKLRELFL
jgi:hypothetical protein